MAESIFWMSFVIADETTTKGTYGARYTDLIDRVYMHAGGWWDETTSFVVFQTTSTRDAVLASIKRAVDPSTDIVVLGSPLLKIMDVVGASKNFKGLQGMVPFAKKV